MNDENVRTWIGVTKKTRDRIKHIGFKMAVKTGKRWKHEDVIIFMLDSYQEEKSKVKK